MRLRPGRLLGLLAALSLGWACAVWLSGGIAFTVLGTRVVSHSLWRPLGLAALATGALVWLEGLNATLGALVNLGRRLSSARLAASFACVVLLLGARFGTWTASGPDPFAYVSQAALWRSGHLDVPMPLAGDAPWPRAAETFTPWGYRASRSGAPAIVPITAPGLPMLMAAVQSLGGYPAAFLISPIAGAVVVWLTFAIGRQARSESTGLIAAWLVATSPAFLFMVMWPMTDVPAAACTALMIWLLLKTSRRAAGIAGLVGSTGVLVRPTFAALACGAIAWLAIEHLHRGRQNERGRLAAFLAGLVPGVGLTAALNARWHGSLLSSGYGAIGNLLALSHVGPNLLRYLRWLLETSPVAIAGIVALLWFVARLREPAARRVFSLLAVAAAAAWLPYLLYAGFDDWWYLRFLLPAWPAMFVAAAAGLDAMRARGRLARIVIALAVVGLGLAGLSVTQRRGVFTLHERRYATVARLVSSITESSAVILTVQHCGTVRFYGGRQTLRWDVLDPAWLDRTIAWLSAQGRHPYLLIEDWEEPQFEARFASLNRDGRLSLSPTLAWQSVRRDGWIFLFDPLARGAVTWNPGPELENAEPFCARPSAPTAETGR